MAFLQSALTARGRMAGWQTARGSCAGLGWAGLGYGQYTMLVMNDHASCYSDDGAMPLRRGSDGRARREVGAP